MKKIFPILLLLASFPFDAFSQSRLYPQHFDLCEVSLGGGILKNAMQINNRLLMEYDHNRLLTPIMRQAGFADWEKRHPNFRNWAEGDFRLDGHIAGHYLSALAFGFASSGDKKMKAELLSRLNYMVDMIDKAQSSFDGDKSGMYGYAGGMPHNEMWINIYNGNPTFAYKAEGRDFYGAVPFYVIHKMYAGLRDAYIYAGNEKAKKCFKKLCDWGINLVSNLSDKQLQDLLKIEHGGMNEVYADAYKIFGEQKYLDAAKRYSQTEFIDGMQTLNRDFLSGKHANTQVPKYIGFERISQLDKNSEDAGLMSKYNLSARNFWTDVVENRTLSFGGNSVDEHFLHQDQGMRYIERTDGPESCNTNNMLKLSEMLFDDTHDAKYADFYEKAMLNHILSTQNPRTGGYVYFTSVRPMHYRMYSQVNKGMWCCVGTGMENHGKYAHFIYTHDKDTLFVNLFVESSLKNKKFALRQTTKFPYEPKSEIVVEKSGMYSIAVRKPSWCKNFGVFVNGEKSGEETSGYLKITRNWKKGDKISVSMPMELSLQACPSNEDYVAFTYGPVALGAVVSREELVRQFAEEGRMDHAPGIGKQWNLLDAPILLGDREKLLEKIRPCDISKLEFKIDESVYADKKHANLILQPFFKIHEARYMLYWFQPSKERWQEHKNKMLEIENAKQELEKRTLDFVATGEQQSDAGHVLKGSFGKGEYNGEKYVDSWIGGWFSYLLERKGKKNVALRMRFTAEDSYRKCTISINGKVFKENFSPVPQNGERGFFEIEMPIPESFLTESDEVVVKFEANKGTPNPGLYYLRLVEGK